MTHEILKLLQPQISQFNFHSLPGCVRRLQWNGLTHSESESLALLQHGNRFSSVKLVISGHRHILQHITDGFNAFLPICVSALLRNGTHAKSSPPFISTAWIKVSKLSSVNRFNIACTTDLNSCSSCAWLSSSHRVSFWTRNLQRRRTSSDLCDLNMQHNICLPWAEICGHCSSSNARKSGRHMAVWKQNLSYSIINQNNTNTVTPTDNSLTVPMWLTTRVSLKHQNMYNKTEIVFFIGSFSSDAPQVSLA